MSGAALLRRVPQSDHTPALDEALDELEQQRRHAIASWWKTAAALLCSLPLGAAPIALLFLLGSGHPLGERLAALLPGAARLWLMDHAVPFGIAAASAPFVWAIVALWAWRRFALEPRSEYLWRYKQRIFGRICEEHFPGISYEPAGGMPWSLLDDSDLFPFACDTYSSEDRFAGRWGATAVTFSEAVAQRKVTRGWGKNRETVHETYFRGIVFSADFNKNFHSTTRLVPKGAECRRVRDESRAELEHPAFANAFDTWTTDQVDARYVLSPALLERFTALQTRFPALRARFHEGTLLLLLPTRRDLFEPSLYRPANDDAELEQFVADVQACLAVVDDLNLNTRIWSKT
jgi:hypothetical protein